MRAEHSLALLIVKFILGRSISKTVSMTVAAWASSAGWHSQEAAPAELMRAIPAGGGAVPQELLQQGDGLVVGHHKPAWHSALSWCKHSCPALDFLHDSVPGSSRQFRTSASWASTSWLWDVEDLQARCPGRQADSISDNKWLQAEYGEANLRTHLDSSPLRGMTLRVSSSSLQHQAMKYTAALTYARNTLMSPLLVSCTGSDVST